MIIYIKAVFTNVLELERINSVRKRKVNNSDDQFN
jgi:hypothetical protein